MHQGKIGLQLPSHLPHRDRTDSNRRSYSWPTTAHECGRDALKRIEGLAHDPRPSGSEKLSGQERFRVRQGTYRIVSEIKDQELIVTAVKIGHRRDVYRFL